nr:hypothetical protein [Mycoplasmopsis bovis]
MLLATSATSLAAIPFIVC